MQDHILKIRNGEDNRMQDHILKIRNGEDNRMQNHILKIRNGEDSRMQDYILSRKAEIGGCMDIRVHNGHLYVIQNGGGHPGGRLCVLTPDGNMIASYTGIGNARQIEISGSIAIVTAREDGLWIFDIGETEPQLLCHYRTVEFATGAALYANYALVSCRQFGVEIIDIAEPAHPRHIGIIRIGEVQSACVCDGILYGGIWGGMAVAAVDIRDITRPTEIARIPLEARGDGVFVKDGILYAVTGQHPREITDLANHDDPLFGAGNGLSVFDVHDPQNPVRLFRDTFGICYNNVIDMWRPALCGDRIVCGCSSLGVFVYDKHTYELLMHLELPDCAGIEQRNSPPLALDGVTGFAALDSRLYVTSQRGGLFCCDTGMPLGQFERWDTSERFAVSPHPFTVKNARGITLRQLYIPGDESPVLDICTCGDYYAVACAAGGIRILDSDFREIKIYPTDTFAVDVKYAGGLLAAALADGGIGLWQMDGTDLTPISRIHTVQSATQLHLTADGQYLFAAVGSTGRLLYDITDRENPVLLERSSNGMMYGDNFLRGTLNDGSVLFFPHRSGLHCANPTAGDTKIHRILYNMHRGIFGYGPESGADTDGRIILHTMDGGYVILPREEGIYADDLPVYKAEEPIAGKITICGSLLAAAERARGSVSVTDISDLEHPRTLGSLYTNTSPGKPIFLNGRILMAGGHGGLCEIVMTQ